MKFIKNVLETEVDGLRGNNHYIINGMYDLIDNDGIAEIVFKLVDEFDMTWNEIERDGGIAQVNKDLKECYGV